MRKRIMLKAKKCVKSLTTTKKKKNKKEHLLKFTNWNRAFIEISKKEQNVY